MSQLKTLREELGLSQRELAVQSGVDRTTISNIERGAAKNVTMRTLEKLSSPLKCLPKDLL